MSEQTVQDPPASSTRKKESIWEVYWPSKYNEDATAIPVASFPMIIYFWPSLFAFLFCGVSQQFGWLSPQVLGWVATAFLAFNLMIIVTDLDQKKFIIVALVLILIAAGAWITTLKDLGFVNHIYDWLRGLDVSYSTHAYYVLFFFLWFFFVIGMVQPRFNYWRLESNEFVHYIQPWGRDQSVPRLGSTVTREVPDVLELLLTFGGGTLVIRREGQVVARIQHVPFLGRRMASIEQMLGVTRVKHT
ncbi:MAG: hypothetical protein GY711_12880 [bacterium]|nr:hypothetical protein [bacterium]